MNYSSDDEIVETETEKSKGKRAVPESRKPASESSGSKSSSSEELIIGGDNLPADGLQMGSLEPHGNLIFKARHWKVLESNSRRQ